MTTVEEKVDDLVKQSERTTTALGILVKEVAAMRDDIRPMADAKSTMNRLCTEHDERAVVVREMKTTLQTAKQTLGLRDDGTSKMGDQIEALIQKCNTYETYFKLMGIGLAALLLFASGIGQKIVLILLGL